MKSYTYDIEKYDFKNCLVRRFAYPLEMLYQGVEDSEKEHTIKTEQYTKWHNRFYEDIENSDFFHCFENFVRTEVPKFFNGESFVYQRVPTFRVQHPNNLSVAHWHRDKDYSHSPDEINFFLPMTRSENTNAVWVESEPNKKDFKPMEAEYGEYVVWDGANCKHGNKKNKEGYTRVSVDFRAMTYENYLKHEEVVLRENKVSVTVGVRMLLGEYYQRV